MKDLIFLSHIYFRIITVVPKYERVKRREIQQYRENISLNMSKLHLYSSLKFYL